MIALLGDRNNVNKESSLRAGNDLLNRENSTSGEDTTHWNKGIGWSLPSDRSTAPGMGYTGRRVTGQTRWAKFLFCESAVPTCVQDFIWIGYSSQILFKSPFVQAIRRSTGFLAYARLRTLSLAYAPRKIVDRKALLRTKTAPSLYPSRLLPQSFAGPSLFFSLELFRGPGRPRLERIESSPPY